MESYIVRLYRRDIEDPAKIAGLVEIVANGEVKNFTDKDGLYRVICRKVKDKKRRPGMIAAGKAKGRNHEIQEFEADGFH